ncbi:nucleoside-binding protein [Peptoclostridium litorale DSM 5388]|uniref:Purine-binding protein n=1 Tax=Peptoclostridium litorale DSM 5388 TaxID=1121324 RepID=A0A069RA25_PEPLI|nr:BMP family ABC transporter substrate-binding protein [Peptoclostridium litorale]KDR93929.1 purine-binding protein [Peptoclostridium litorale DSM 5388]KDR95356.1 purine-binding protein [Peptoclostridium litorale DSM 5388]SIN88782.1 nucleoside-binding protein [Peptoclostridium litorale DSM 5388]
MKKKIFAVMMSLVLVFSLALTGCGSKEESSDQPAETSADSMKVGFIYVGPIGDGGWSYAHNEARLYLENELGVSTIYKESVPEGPEVEKIMRDMIDQGAKVIFATSFGYMDYVEKISKEYPDVKFLHCSGYKDGENMSNYFGRMYEPRYLSGVVAGMKTQTNKIGYVAAFEIPEVIRGINAFTLGVKSVNPEASVAVRWTHTWYDPVSEKAAAESLLDEGSDVIAQHQDTAGPQQAAQEKGAFSIGYNTDMKEMAPQAYLTAPVWNWGPYYVKQVKAAMDGTWKSENYWGGMEDEVVQLAPMTELVPSEAVQKVTELEGKIKDGSLKVFAGPIKDNEGNVVVKEGEVLTDEQLLSMDWLVEGVEGSIKK